MAMTLYDYSSKPFGEKAPAVYIGSGAPEDNAIFNAGDIYFRVGDVAAGQAFMYVATAASGTWKANDALDS